MGYNFSLSKQYGLICYKINQKKYICLSINCYIPRKKKKDNLQSLFGELKAIPRGKKERKKNAVS